MPPSVLHGPEDYQNWDKLIAHCSESEGLEETEKTQAVDAFRTLRAVLGNDFLKRAYGEHHPIFRMLINTAPWTRRWIARLSQIVLDMESADPSGFRKVLRQLRDPKRYNAALSVLQVGNAFHRAGLPILLEPAIDGFPGTPDLKLTDLVSKQEMYVEVADLYASKSATKAWQSMDTILFILSALPAGLEHCGHLYRTLSQPHLKHVAKQIHNLIDEVSRQPSFRELLLEDVIELAVAPTDDPRLSVWASSRGLKLREFLGSPYDSAEINRIRSKMYKEQKQLPPNTPNILVIANDGLFLENHDFIRIIREFEEALYEHPHVLFLAVIGRWYGNRSVNSMQIREHRIAIQESQTLMFPEARIIMLNKFAVMAVSRDMQSKILEAIENRFSR